MAKGTFHKGAFHKGAFHKGDCVRIADGRPGRVRSARAGTVRVRVRRRGRTTDELLDLPAAELSAIDPPKGWMSPEGYNRRVNAIRRRSADERGGH